MKKGIQIVLAVVIIALTVFSVPMGKVNAARQMVDNRVTFTQNVSNSNPRVGDVITVTLSFATKDTETLPLDVKVVNPNPNPAYLVIIPASVSGGSTYVSSVGSGGPEGVIWTGRLEAAGSLPHVISFQMRIVGMPKTAMTTGYQLYNVAQMSDEGTGSLGGSLPIQSVESQLTIYPMQTWLSRIYR